MPWVRPVQAAGVQLRVLRRLRPGRSSKGRPGRHRGGPTGVGLLAGRLHTRSRGFAGRGADERLPSCPGPSSSVLVADRRASPARRAVHCGDIPRPPTTARGINRAADSRPSPWPDWSGSAIRPSTIVCLMRPSCRSARHSCAVTSPATTTPLAWQPDEGRSVGGGAEGIRTPDLRIANEQDRYVEHAPDARFQRRGPMPYDTRPAEHCGLPGDLRLRGAKTSTRRSGAPTSNANSVPPLSTGSSTEMSGSTCAMTTKTASRLSRQPRWTSSRAAGE